MYVKICFNVTVSYLTVSTNDFLNNTNNNKAFQEIKILFEDNFKITTQKGSVLKHLNFSIYQYYLGFSIDKI